MLFKCIGTKQFPKHDHKRQNEDNGDKYWGYLLCFTYFMYMGLMILDISHSGICSFNKLKAKIKVANMFKTVFLLI